MKFIPKNGHIYVELFDIKKSIQNKEAEEFDILLPETKNNKSLSEDSDYEFVKVISFPKNLEDLNNNQILVVDKVGLREIKIDGKDFLILGGRSYIIGEVILE